MHTIGQLDRQTDSNPEIVMMIGNQNFISGIPQVAQVSLEYTALLVLSIKLEIVKQKLSLPLNFHLPMP